MKAIKCIFVGKLKEPWAKAARDHYFEALSRFQPVEEITIKDASGSLPEDERRNREGSRILEKTGPGDFLIALDAKGKPMPSEKLAQRLGQWLEDPGRRPCFIIGGAFGLSDEVLKKADLKLGFGPMTLPHELARVVLLEQLYRAHSILRGAPYHH
jgi:23S rRNA (pseudouridine1915-N3)-methyltransferase